MASVQERLGELETRVSENANLLTLLEKRFDRFEERIDARFDAVDRRFDVIDRRFDVIDRRFEGVDRRFEGLDRRFDELDKKLSKQFALVMTMLMSVIAAFVGSVVAVVVK